MDAMELYELVKDWPEGARPPYATFSSPEGFRSKWYLDVPFDCKDDPYCTDDLPVDTAVLLHEASAIRYCCRMGYMPDCYIDGETGEPDQEVVYVVSLHPFRLPTVQAEASTLIEALAAALRSTQGLT